MCDVKRESKLRKKNKQEKSESGKAAMRPGLCYALASISFLSCSCLSSSDKARGKIEYNAAVTVNFAFSLDFTMKNGEIKFTFIYVIF